MTSSTRPTVAVLVLGHRGATASTTIAASKLAHRADWAAHLLSAKSAGLVDPSEIAWAGWDPFASRESWQKTLERHGVLDLRRWPELPTTLRHKVRELEPIALDLDHAVANRETSASIGSGRELLERLRAQIRLFKEASGAQTLVLVNLSAPALLPPRERW